MREAELRLEQGLGELHRMAVERTLREGLRLEQREAMLRERLVNALRGEQQRLEKATEAIESRSPQRILQLGFAVLRAEGKALKSVRELEKHRQLTVELSDGTTEITQTL